jgi:hypothetical protein
MSDFYKKKQQPWLKMVFKWFLTQKIAVVFGFVIPRSRSVCMVGTEQLLVSSLTTIFRMLTGAWAQ